MNFFKKEINKALKRIISTNTDIIGFSVIDPKERLTMEFIKIIKKERPNVKIILGGPACFEKTTIKPFTNTIPDLIDAYVVREGETTLFELITKIKNKEKISNIPGVLIYKNKQYLNFTKREHIKNLDEVGFPTYEEFNLNNYKHRSIKLEWSRGCIGNCSFCKARSLWGYYRTKSPESIIEEIDYHVKYYGIKEFTLCDNVVGGNVKQLEEICDYLIKKKYNIRLSGHGAVLKKVDANLMQKMKKAGFHRLEYGIETGSNKILKNMNKYFNVEEGERIIRLAHEVGITVVLFQIVGFPGETREDFQETLKFFNKNAKNIDIVQSVNTLHVITNTAIHKNPDKFKINLPTKNEHFDWISKNGLNTYKERVRRVHILEETLKKLGIQVIENNTNEGNTLEIENVINKISETKSGKKIKKLKIVINTMYSILSKITKKIKKHEF